MKKIIYSSFLFVFAFILFLCKDQAASFAFSPPNRTIPKNCNNEVTIKINTEGEYSNAADIEVRYDPAKIQIIDSWPSVSGVQVGTGDAYESYLFNNVDTTLGIIKVAAGSIFNQFHGNKTFITIQFRSIAETTEADFTITYTGVGNTLDSNIAQSTTNLDILNSVVNGHYTFSNQECNKDVIPPIIRITQPDTINIEGRLQFILDISDVGGGVDLDTFSMIVNGISYNRPSLIFTYTGTPNRYIVNIDPTITVAHSQQTEVTFMVQDFAKNTGTARIVFNPIQITTLPETGVICTDNVVIIDKINTLIEKQNEKDVIFGPSNTQTVDNFIISMGKVNNTIPNMSILSLLSVFFGLQSIYSIISLVIMIIRRRKVLIKYWGEVINNEKGIPLQNISVKLLDSDHKVVAKTKTDLYGRYIFDMEFGQYYVVIENNQFKTLTEQITILDDEKIFKHALEYKSKIEKLRWHQDRINYVFVRDYLVFSILGFLLSMLGVIMSTNPLTITIFVINLIIVSLSIILKLYYASEYGD